MRKAGSSKASAPLTVGGQAVIEGVMMRSPWRVATACRTPDGDILVKAAPFVSLTRRHPVAKLPVLRGAVGLFEAMKIGVGSLNWSAEVAGEEDPDRKPSIWDQLLSVVMTLVAFGLGIGLFMAVPYAVAGLIPQDQNQVLFHLVAGSLRIVLLIGYMAGISLIPDIKTVFRYHGAEHKSIFAFEKKLDMVTMNAAAQSRFHPRCGTSFLLLAAVLTMVLFMVFDSIWVATIGPFIGVWDRVLIHLPLIPLMAGLSYEVLRIAEKNAEKPMWRPAVLPGFWLQRITTREPDEKQVDVALAALHESLLKEEGAYEGAARSLRITRGESDSDAWAEIIDEKDEKSSIDSEEKPEKAESAA